MTNKKKESAAPETVEQIKQRMAQAIENRRKQYLEEYRDLCNKHKFQIVPQMVLRGGLAPRVELFAEPVD